MPKTIAVVDGNSLMHRAFHAIPPSMVAPDGRPTNAIFGFLSMFLKLNESFTPDAIVVAFDKGKPRVRMEMLPQYKAQRPPMDETLHVQFPMVKDLLVAMDVPVVESEGWEGDDILGTLARMGSEQGMDMLLVTGDRDMYQLSSDRVKIVSTRKGVSDVNIMTPESVEDLYHGITPELVPDFYGLKGDSSDNIPGVPGIGPKKASALIVQYGNLDEVIAHADEVKGKMGENLRAHIDDALLSRKVATIRTDAPVECDLDGISFPSFDAATVRDAMGELGFTTLADRVLALVGGAASPDLELPELLEGTAAVARVEQAIADGAWLGAAPYEPDDAGTLFGGEGGVVFATADAAAKLEGEAAYDMLARALTEGHVASLDVKELMHLLSPVDSRLDERLDPVAVEPERIFDACVAAYLVDSSAGDYPAADLAQTYLGVRLPEDADEPAAVEAVLALALVDPLAKRLEADGAWPLFSQVEMALVGVLAAMERTGLYVDPAILAAQSAELGQSIDELRAHIFEQAGEEFNIDSPQQLSHVLFDNVGLPTKGLKKTARGFYSTNAQVLDRFAVQYPVVADVIEYREKSKLKSTYLDALPGLVALDGRIHTSLNQTVAATGRLSSSNPNLQNIPVRSELGRHVRNAFSVGEGNVFLACDYSQIELRLLAHLSGDEHLVEAFRSGADFHAATAARTFGVGFDEVTPELRSRAKAVNFGIVYGQQAYGLSQSLKIPMGEAQEMIDRYFEAYPQVRTFLDQTVEFARKHLWVATLYGRRRYVRDIAARVPAKRAFGERTAMNHPMQGTAADIIKIAMARVERRLRDEGLKSRLILQIHDELDFEVPQDEIEQLSALVREVMEGVVELSVPLIADVSYGATWADAK